MVDLGAVAASKVNWTCPEKSGGRKVRRETTVNEVLQDPPISGHMSISIGALGGYSPRRPTAPRSMCRSASFLFVVETMYAVVVACWAKMLFDFKLRVSGLHNPFVTASSFVIVDGVHVCQRAQPPHARCAAPRRHPEHQNP
ncbi:hypothetical protein FIBSPDRAFT_182914 [Athelia psychrophila]|uniref:Uncharacterized protein n=1 Tax=Athelia psychrophila TaxID=1759441 RepID=A0A166AH92_9AGAM|nr:hypothetical protein FIBSPDRAFT_182914 [Fibularhizoctonia sp. CBS 109695]